jgi:hypothetical protein
MVLLLSVLPAFADPTPGPSTVAAPGAPAPAVFVTVSHLGESEQQAALRQGQLLAHHRATDPFGNTIRGPYKALPQVVQIAAPTPGQETTTPAPVVDVPTLEKAVQGLTIGAVNLGAHEILIGSRSVREGDLLVLESGGRQFATWVQKVGVHGVLFCDINLKKQLLKSFATGPKEFPAGSVPGTSDIHHFLNKDSPP